MTWVLLSSFLVLVVAILIGLFPAVEYQLAKIDRLQRRLLTARRALLCVFFTALAVPILLSTIIDKPIPRVHDEFSHLLAADTFRHGRLTNPTHPHWQSFETFHVIHEPSYMSKFAPAPDFFLALGWAVTGEPISGAWLLHALACVSVAWMVMAFLPMRWAWLGGMALAIHPQMITWSQSFWGGSTAVLGGALLVGGLERLGRGEVRSGWSAAFGMFLLANSRPYEGFVLTALVGLRFLFIVRREPRAKLMKLLAPLAVGGLITLSFIGYYNYRLTGDARAFPHRFYAASYAPSPLFVGGSLSPTPEYRHEEMRRYHLGPEMAAYEMQQTPKGIATAFLIKTRIVFEAAFNLPLSFGPKGPLDYVWWGVLPLLFLPAAIKRGRDRWVWLVLGLFFLASFSILWTQPHYAAPVVGLVVLGMLRLLQHARAVGFRWKGGRRLVLVIMGLAVASFIGQVAGIMAGPPGPWRAARSRLEMIKHLEELPGKDVVFVGYAPNHFLNFEWVYNEADIDGSEIVWTRRSDAESNDELIRYYPDRRVWLVDADAIPPRLIPLERPQGED